MKVVVVGGGARARAGRGAGADGRGGRHAGQPGHRGVDVDAARGARRRPRSSSVPSSRSSTGSPTGCGRRARRVFGPGADGAELEGSKQFMKDLVTRRRRAHRPLRGVHGGRAGARLPAHAPGAVRREDRRAGRRQGRARHRVAGRGRGGRAGQAVRLVVRRCRPARRDRGGPHRARGVGLRGVRRDDGGRAAAGPGLQAGRRRRRRPEHGRHGRVVAAAVPRPTGSPTTSSTGSSLPTLAGLRGPRHRLPRCALRRAHGHARGAEADRVQRPLRRPGLPGRCCCA